MVPARDAAFENSGMCLASGSSRSSSPTSRSCKMAAVVKVFVIDATGTIRYAEYVPEVADHPNYDAVLACAKQLTD